jgi:hypothetical protein
MQDFSQLNNYIFPLLIVLIVIAGLIKIWEWTLDRRESKDKRLKSKSRQREVTLFDDDEQEEDDYSTSSEKFYDVSAYATKDSLLSPAEINFYHVLKQVVGDSAIISPKVNLWDIFFIKRGNNANYMALKAKIDRKHVDFLLCHTQTMKPIIGIELDDNSHQRTDKQMRDHFVDRVFSAAGLPIVHIPVQHSYNTETISELLRQYLLSTKAMAEQNTTASSELICPKCRGDMVLRTVKSGKNAGRKFWGCSNYPNCRHLVPYKG